MFESYAIILPLGLIILYGLLLWFILGIKHHWLFKIILTPCVVFFSIFVWYSITDMLGWPVGINTPHTFRVYWIEVIERDSVENSNIYIMLQDLSNKHNKKPNWVNLFINYEEPRLYRLPYSHDAGKQAAYLQGLISQGARVVLTKEQQEANQSSSSNENSGKVNQGTVHTQNDAPLGYILPPHLETPKGNLNND